MPEPKPVETDYDIAALYFPGWPRVEAWQRVWNVCPERKPVLGWYDESNPEVVDWQIKWLVENGIRTLYVDWYWHQGRQHLDHWVKAFYKAKYRRHLKWAMMWANHNPAGSHSEEDQRAVTKFWIENYFNTPEYLRIDDKPVVWIWAAANMDRDLGPGGCKKLLDISRQMAREAGYKGIYFIAMKWPEADWGEKAVQSCKDRGFDMTSIYHFMDHGGKAKSGRRYSYDLCVEASLPAWRKRQASGILPFMPNLSTGWDDRPWNDHCEIYGRREAPLPRAAQRMGRGLLRRAERGIRVRVLRGRARHVLQASGGRLAAQLRSEGRGARPIRPPAARADAARLRLGFHGRRHAGLARDDGPLGLRGLAARDHVPHGDERSGHLRVVRAD